MKHKLTNPDTAESTDCEVDLRKWDLLQSQIDSDTSYLNWLDDTDLPAKLKNLIKKLVDGTIHVGTKVYNFGKFILELTRKFYSRFPQAALGALFGLVIGLIFNLIPWIGPFLSALITPITVLIGASIGMGADLLEMRMKQTIKQAISETL
ncbi:MAG TPA: hypothetical protein EYQ14_07480 [Gammaproteobacteria bacterium]|nr:hypothetical protein [Gammaproteobacteria bacterium]